MSAIIKARENADTILALARKAKQDRNTLSAPQTIGNSGLTDSREADRSRKQYALNTGWTYASTRPIAVRCAKQPVRLGKVVKGQKAFTKRRLPEHLKSMVSDDAGVELIESHPFIQAISDPNEWMVQWTLMYITALSLQLTGRAYWWIVDSNRRPGGFDLWPVPSHWVEADHSQGFRAGWIIKPHGMMQEIHVAGERIVPFYLPDASDPFASRSPMDAAQRAVETSDAIRTAQRATFDNMALPALAFIAGDIPGPDGTTMSQPQLEKWQREQIENSLKQLFKGVGKWGRSIILDATIKDVKLISNKPFEMDFQDSSKLAKDEIMQIFGVNPIIAGQVEGANRASSVVANENFLDNVINPLLTLMSQVINSWVLPLFTRGKDGLLAWIEEAKAIDPDGKREDLRLLAGMGGLTVDEARAEYGFAPLPNGKGQVLIRSMAQVVEPLEAEEPDLEPDDDDEGEIPDEPVAEEGLPEEDAEPEDAEKGHAPFFV